MFNVKMFVGEFVGKIGDLNCFFYECWFKVGLRLFIFIIWFNKIFNY